MVLAVLLPWGAALACGGRTGDLGPDGFDAGSGGSGVGTVVSTGAAPGAAARGSTGTGTTVTSPGSSTPAGAAGSSVGVSRPPPTKGFPSAGGATGAGGWYNEGCTYPACNCGDCLTSCRCSYSGGGSPLCEMQCGFGTAGAPGAGGAIGVADAGTISTGPTACYSAPNQVDYCAPLSVPVNTCCTGAGRCGVELFSAPAPANIPFAPGCQEAHQFGINTPACPDFAQLLNMSGSAGAPNISGCCRPDGTCGLDLGLIGAGCVQSVIGGKPIYCAIYDGGAFVDADLPLSIAPAEAGTN